MLEAIDGSLTDILTLVVAAVYAFFRLCRCSYRERTTERFISDLSYGVSIYPLLLLALTAVSSKATEKLMQGNNHGLDRNAQAHIRSAQDGPFPL
jgi:heme exporter protein D